MNSVEWAEPLIIQMKNRQFPVVQLKKMRTLTPLELYQVCLSMALSTFSNTGEIKNVTLSCVILMAKEHFLQMGAIPSDQLPASWDGKVCEEDTDECDTHSPCARENATRDCENLPGSYNCHCKFGYTEPHCDSVLDFCEEGPCKNNASCESTDIVGFNCTCIPGFTGETCETNIDESEGNDCVSGSTCVDGTNQYTCDCIGTGFRGQFCDESCVNSSACENSASCLFNQTSDEFFCDCSSNFQVQLCSEQLSGGDNDDGKLLTAGAALLAILIIVVVTADSLFIEE
ncbi:fibropellin-1-like [Symsagittifera roscoffensis]|uniref:fibropellin-1-like n=1 Tax=Symsagittifera roscoffensis TaxID=84072 RepID=UPI00307BC42D